MASLKELYRKDWVLKVFSLGFAMLLWFFVIGEEKAEVSLSIPVEIVNVPGECAIANDVVSTINLRVYGPRGLVRGLSSQDLTRVIDLRNARPGTVTVHITPDSIPVPSGVIVTQIQPSAIDILLEPYEYRVVPVHPVVTGKVAPDYEVKEIQQMPKNIKISGPRTVLSRIKEVGTAPIDITDAHETVSRDIQLDLKEPRVTADENVVRVTVVIAPVIGQRKFTHVPVRVEPQSNHVVVKPAILTVVVEGARARLKDLGIEDISASVAVDGLEAGRHEIAPDVLVPEGFYVTEIIPDRIKVRVSSPPKGGGS
ncbi:MAG: hypothetical protein K6360_03990 [Deltaproteobacteria bacterium]